MLSLLSFVRVPAWHFLLRWSQIIAYLDRLGRIQRFLALEERRDPRLLRDFSIVSSSTQQDGFESTDLAKQREREMESRCVSLDMVSVLSHAEPERMLLHNLDLSLPLTTLTMVVGGVGATNTTFLKTILGETSLSSGGIYTSSLEIAYCDQKIWLPNDTIQNSIIGPTQLDDERYSSVITACALDTDFGTQSQFHIGPNGNNLSVSQRCKVALARALYSSCPLVVCDDMLGRFDDNTATTIFNAVFSSEGLLKKQQRTSVLVVSQASWLSAADQIVYLLEDGTASVYRGTDSVQKFIAVKSHLTNITTNIETAQNLTSAALEYDLTQARQAMVTPPKTLDMTLISHSSRSVPPLLLAGALSLAILNGFLERSQGRHPFITR